MAIKPGIIDPFDTEEKPTAGRIIDPFDNEQEEPIFPKKKEEPTLGGEFVKGVKQGIEQTKGLGYGLAGLAGEITGIKPLQEWGISGYKEKMEAAKQHEGAIPSYEDIGGVGDFAKYAAHGIGTVVPTIVTSMGTGGVGGLVGKKLAQKAVEKGLTRAAMSAATDVGVKAGAGAGAFAASSGMEMGGIYGDQVEEGKTSPMAAVIGGMAAGALDVIPEFRLARTMGLLKKADKAVPAARKATGNFLTRVAKEGVKQAGLEGLTEGMQTVIERAANKYANPHVSMTDKQAIADYINSALIGAISGGAFGTGGKMIGEGLERFQKDTGTVPPPTPTPTPEQAQAEPEGAIPEAPTPPPSVSGERTEVNPINFTMPVQGPEGVQYNMPPALREEGAMGEPVSMTDQEAPPPPTATAIPEAPVTPQPVNMTNLEDDRRAREEQQIEDELPDLTMPRGALPAEEQWGLTPRGVMDEWMQARAFIDNLRGNPDVDPADIQAYEDEYATAATEENNRLSAMAIEMLQGLGIDDPTILQDIGSTFSMEVWNPANADKPIGTIFEEIADTYLSSRIPQRAGIKQAAPTVARGEGTITGEWVPGSGGIPERPLLDLDRAAHEAATSPLNERPQPTPAQAEAGNYKKGHIKVAGLDISIENPQGSTREGTTPEGKPWKTEMQSHYGYIRGIHGKDKDHLDTFIGQSIKDRGMIYVVDQQNPKTKDFDEHKVMIGYDSLKDARRAYLENYEPGWEGLKDITPMTIEGFKQWTKAGKVTQPASKAIEFRAPEQIDYTPERVDVPEFGGQGGRYGIPEREGVAPERVDVPEFGGQAGRFGIPEKEGVISSEKEVKAESDEGDRGQGGTGEENLQVTPEGEAEGIPGPPKETFVSRIDNAVNEQDKDRAFTEWGLEAVPGIRLGDALEAGRYAYLVAKGEIPQASFDGWIEQARKENRIRPEGKGVEAIPEEIKDAIQSPERIPEEEGVKMKFETKKTLIEKIKSGEIKGSEVIRMTNDIEVHSIAKTGQLRPGKDAEGRSGISAQTFNANDPIIVAYGSHTRMSAALIIPFEAVVGTGEQPNEVKIKGDYDVSKIRFVMDGYENIMTYDEVKKVFEEGKEEKAEETPPAIPEAPTPEPVPEPTPEREEPKPPEKKEGEVIPYSASLKITNLDQLPKGAGLRYLEVVKGEGDTYVAKQWRKAIPEGAIVIDMEAGKQKTEKKPAPGVTTVIDKAGKEHDIPEDLTVKVKAIRAKTGKEVEVSENAREAISKIERDIKRYEALAECVKS